MRKFLTCLVAIFILCSGNATAAELYRLDSATNYTPPPPRYAPPQVPDYGLPKPAYTPPPPPPTQPPPTNKKSVEINLQELAIKKMPVLPERIRYRNSRRTPTKIITQPIEFPRYKSQKAPPIYTQRQPKQPPKVYVPRRPTAFAGDRGGSKIKNFGPPRARYR